MNISISNKKYIIFGSLTACSSIIIYYFLKNFKKRPNPPEFKPQINMSQKPQNSNCTTNFLKPVIDTNTYCVKQVVGKKINKQLVESPVESHFNDIKEELKKYSENNIFKILHDLEVKSNNIVDESESQCIYNHPYNPNNSDDPIMLMALSDEI